MYGGGGFPRGAEDRAYDRPFMSEDDATAIAELRKALSQPLPEIPTKYLYDDRGSELFEKITELEEYYPTRTEEAILRAHADEIIGIVEPRELAELGSGAGTKIRMLLDAMGRHGSRERCVMLDINEHFLESSVVRLEDEYPGLEVRGIVGDFTKDLDRLGPGGDRLMLFLASTIGNLKPDEAATFMKAAAAQLEPGDGFLVGFDLVKERGRLEAAYNDAEGVTAEFNQNILRVLNARFDADFDPEAFEHVAFFDEDESWMDLRLRATRPMNVRIAAADLTLDLAEGDEIRTEVSCKYTAGSAAALAAKGGLTIDHWFTDAEHLFALGLLRPD